MVTLPINGIDGNHTAKIARLSILSTFGRLTMAFNQIVLPLFVLAIGLDASFYGVLVAAAGYVQGVVLFPAGWFSDRRGRGIAILLGGLFAGSCLLAIPFITDSILILVVYAITGIGTGFTRTSIDSLIADHTRKGDERTRSFGYTTATATMAAMIGSFVAGLLLDPIAFPFISDDMTRYAILFWAMGFFRIATGVFGIYTERWLNVNDPVEKEQKEIMEIEDEDPQKERHDTETALLFGTSQLLMGISSGMVIPYLILWIYAAFGPDPIVLGSVPAIAGITLATGTLAVGFFSERIGKIRTISVLYTLTPILMIGLVYSPWFLLMLVFYVARNAVANMNRPAFNSLFMGEVSLSRRARSLSITRVMWQFPRQTGTLMTAYLLGFFGGIVSFGLIVFPIAMLLYPVSVIPLYIAVKRNSARQPLKIPSEIEIEE
ncbi:MAG: MFS transporter [Candidatus Thorarchaeota archaeon]|nr:MFS transporter [Candidatus Thorarchaeota archaeon]